MPQKKLSQTLNEFVNVLVEEELEPIRLSLIRVENDLRADFDELIGKTNEIFASVKEDHGEKISVEDFEVQKDKIFEEVGEMIESRRQKTIDEINAIVEEKYDVLKTAIENLAAKLSDAFAEGFSEQEDHYTEICEKLSDRISALEKRLG